MSRPLISVVTPSYNQAELLEDNLRSVRDQADDSVEHVVVDGGSDDGTVDLLKRYENDYHLRWVSEPDRGQSHAINKGIEMADGKWIGWQNADDYYLPGAFAAFDRTRRTNPSRDVIYGDLLFVDVDRNTTGRRYHMRPSKFVQKHWQHFTANHTTFIREPVFDAIGGLGEGFVYTMDADLFWRLLNADVDLAHIPKFIAAHRVHDQAKTSNKEQSQYQRELEMLYDYSPLERSLPDGLLRLLAVGVKTTYLAAEMRPEAIRYTLGRIVRNRL